MSVCLWVGALVLACLSVYSCIDLCVYVCVCLGLCVCVSVGLCIRSFCFGIFLSFCGYVHICLFESIRVYVIYECENVRM